MDEIAIIYEHPSDFKVYRCNVSTTTPLDVFTWCIDEFDLKPVKKPYLGYGFMIGQYDGYLTENPSLALQGIKSMTTITLFQSKSYPGYGPCVEEQYLFRIPLQATLFNSDRLMSKLYQIARPVLSVKKLLLLSICIKEYPTSVREGCDVDIKYIDSVFGRKGLQCNIMRRNGRVGFQEFKVAINQAQTELLRHHRKYDGFLCLFSGHGTSSSVNPSASLLSLSDGQRVPVTDMLDVFNNSTSGIGKLFCGKPRIYVIQACRGHNGVQTVIPNNNVPDPQGAGGKVYHPDDDVLLIQSSTPRYKSYRNPEKGSYLIKAVCEVLGDSSKVHGVTLDHAVYVIKRDVSESVNGEQSVVSTSTLSSRFILK